MSTSADGSGAPVGAGGAPAPGAGDEAARRRALEHVRGLLVEAGATTEEVDRAVADHVLDLLAVDRLLVPAARQYSAADVSAATGLPLDLLKRFWRALGFLDVADDERAFTELDVRAVALFQEMLRMGATEVDIALQLARVIGSSMARIAEAEVVPGSMTVAAGDDDVLVADEFASMAGETVPAMAWLLEFVWRRHVQAATRRTMLLRSRGLGAGTSPVLAVGFADMVGFTLLSEHLDQDELAEVVRRFDEISHDIVTGLGGRVVKTIGDEAMFVTESVTTAARIGLELAEAYAHDELLSDVRVGLAVGPVLVHDGDYFGPTVNLAHRIVSIADPGTVLMTDELHDRLDAEGAGDLVGRELRPRVLKDLGRVQLWRLVRSVDLDGDADDAATRSPGTTERRRGVRWERLTDVLRDLEELREMGERVGERLFSTGGRVLRTGPAAGGPDREGSPDGDPEGSVDDSTDGDGAPEGSVDDSTDGDGAPGGDGSTDGGPDGQGSVGQPGGGDPPGP